jgi:hypothetical protein
MQPTPQSVGRVKEGGTSPEGAREKTAARYTWAAGQPRAAVPT